MEPNIKFKELRKGLNLNQTEFADKINVSQGTITDIERGRIRVSKRVQKKITEIFGIESGYFNNEIQLNNNEINQGNESGVKQGFDKKGNLIDNIQKDKKSNSFPIDYFNKENFYLKQKFEKKLLIDIVRNHQYINELQGYLNTISNFEFIIDNLNHYYFNKVDLQFHNSMKYLENWKFNYDKFKADFISEIEKLEVIRPALNKLSKAIEAFYEEIKDFDKENIISGYFGKRPSE